MPRARRDRREYLGRKAHRDLRAPRVRLERLDQRGLWDRLVLMDPLVRRDRQALKGRRGRRVRRGRRDRRQRVEYWWWIALGRRWENMQTATMC